MCEKSLLGHIMLEKLNQKSKNLKKGKKQLKLTGGKRRV